MDNWGSEAYLGLRETFIYVYMKFNTVRMDAITERDTSFVTLKPLFAIMILSRLLRNKQLRKNLGPSPFPALEVQMERLHQEGKLGVST